MKFVFLLLGIFSMVLLIRNYRTAFGLYLFAVSMMFMGLCCEYGGLSAYSDRMEEYFSDMHGM